MTKTKHLAIVALSLIVLSVSTGCTSDPEVTLTVTDCATDDITLTASGRSIARSGGQWVVTANAKVTCNGQPVNNAELKLEFWWPNGTFTRTTDSKGEINYRRTVQADPSGQTYNVTIKGNDGEKTESYTFS